MTTTVTSNEPRVGERSPRSRRVRYARWTALAAGALFVIFAVVLASQVGNDPSYRGGRLLDKPAPPIDLPRLEGGRVTTGDLAGKAVIVNFWNTWCIPCQRELPVLKEFQSRHARDADVVLLGIVRDDTEAAVRSYVAAEGIAWTIALDPDARAALDYGTTGQPETYAISRDGVVVGQQFGEVSTASLEAMLACAQGRC